jgi:Chalcone isomerase-like
VLVSRRVAGLKEFVIRRIAISLAVALLALASILHLDAASLAGVTLPDTVTVGNTHLLLNGLGLRTKFMVKVYVAGLYLVQKSSDGDAIVKADETKRIVMHFLHGVSKNQMADAFRESFHDNAPAASQQMKTEIDRLIGALEPLKEPDEMVSTYVPGMGTTVTTKGQEKVTIAGAPFAQMLFSVWLGSKPPNAGLKKGLLGI